MTAVLAMLTALGPLSTDFYLPSLPDIARVMGSDVAGAQATLSAFLFGFAAGQILWGPLSDRLGRRPILLFGLVLFIAATLACAFAPSIGWLTAARALQALGASGPIVLGEKRISSSIVIEIVRLAAVASPAIPHGFCSFVTGAPA